MNVHEYQAKELLRAYGVEVPRGVAAATPDEAERAAREIGGPVAVKAQIHAGGRGKAGGIRIVRTPAEARSAAERLLGRALVTPQTGPGGRIVRRVYVEAVTRIDRELYLGIVVDRAAERISILASEEGGVEIEEVAARSPEKILTVGVDPLAGLHDFQIRNLGFGLRLGPAQVGSLAPLVRALYRIFEEKDASLAEINPLVISGDRAVPLDCKLGFDDNALYRHPELRGLRDPDEEDPREREARERGFSWVSLEGTIGCMVNGAGLAMATMDIIQLCGGAPANFLDVGGAADAERVSHAFRLILADRDVKAILVNIFGGIVLCDVIAEGVIEATREIGVRVPLVVRLDGTNAERGREMLRGSGLDITPAVGMQDAAEKVVAAAAAAS
jgi:succinyl-CoA synthetase beta subunit